MLNLQQLSYIHPDKRLLFSNLNLTISHYDKVALIGNNGVGKSTLLKIIAGKLQPATGQILTDALPYFVPQVFGQYNHLTIAQALKIDTQLHALQEILGGNTSEENFNQLNDDWTIEERCNEALNHWQMSNLDLNLKIKNLSGGQQTKVFLAGIFIHQPKLILLDEPSNHLDTSGRSLLYDFIRSTKSTLLTVSHDRKLLNLLDTVCELNAQEIKTYGGNYNFYVAQKQVAASAFNQHIQNKEKALRKAKEKERESIERQQKSDSRGKAKQEQSGVARIMMNTLRNNAENSTSKVKSVHAEKINGISDELQALRSRIPDVDKMKLRFDTSALYKGKILLTASGVNFSYQSQLLWEDNLSFQITSGERIALKGQNGSGKTTLIKLMLGQLEAQIGTMHRTTVNAVYIDQEYSLIDFKLNIYEQAQRFNSTALQEHEIKIRLSRFLFNKEDWEKPCSTLSGGERMRLVLCCLIIYNQSPDIIILDEPTNNLDIQNIEILTTSINEYRGTLIVISHDETFLEQISIERTLEFQKNTKDNNGDDTTYRLKC